MHILHPALQAAAPHGMEAQAVQKGKWSLCPLLSPQFCPVPAAGTGSLGMALLYLFSAGKLSAMVLP